MASQREQLVSALQRIASECTTSAEVQKKADEERLGVAVTVTYCGRSYMGMAMSHEHSGVIPF